MKEITYYFGIKVVMTDKNMEDTWTLGEYDTAEAAMKAARDWFKFYYEHPSILSVFNGYVEGYIKKYYGLECDDITIIDRVDFGK